jgi:hypothetical protein
MDASSFRPSPDGVAGLADLTCEVCHDEPALGVASVPGVPVSVAYGRKCVAANAHPYHILVANTAAIGGYGEASTWWREMVDATLEHLSIERAKFDQDVTECLDDMAVAIEIPPIIDVEGP